MRAADVLDVAAGATCMQGLCCLREGRAALLAAGAAHALARLAVLRPASESAATPLARAVAALAVDEEGRRACARAGVSAALAALGRALNHVRPTTAAALSRAQARLRLR
jgi:hypothetical protein